MLDKHDANHVTPRQDHSGAPWPEARRITPTTCNLFPPETHRMRSFGAITNDHRKLRVNLERGNKEASRET
jgi:hypothetical protein